MGILGTHLGAWQGTNGFRLTPDDAPYEAAATARVSEQVRGFVTELAYTWSHAEAGEQEGLLVLAAAEESPEEPHGGPDRVVAMLSDTFHQSPSAARLTGTSQDGVTTVGFTYAGDWRWTIVVDATDPARLLVRMDNTVPESAAALGYPPGTYWAMRAELVPSGS